MIQSLRANARPKHKAYGSWEKNEKQNFTGHQELEFKPVSKSKYERYKKRRRAKLAKEQKLLFWERTVVIVILVSVIVALGFYFFSKHFNTSKQIAPIKKENIIDIEQMNYLLNSGYEWLDKNHYRNARFQFNRVLEMNAESKTGFYGLTASYVYECVLDSSNCEKATIKINEYISKYGRDKSIIYLENILQNRSLKNN